MAESAPNIVVLAGPNGAGKSTSAPSILRDALGVDEFVNADVIAGTLGLRARTGGHGRRSHHAEPAPGAGTTATHLRVRNDPGQPAIRPLARGIDRYRLSIPPHLPLVAESGHGRGPGSGPNS